MQILRHAPLKTLGENFHDDPIAWCFSVTAEEQQAFFACRNTVDHMTGKSYVIEGLNIPHEHPVLNFMLAVALVSEFGLEQMYVFKHNGEWWFV